MFIKMHLPIKLILIANMILCISSCTLGGAILDGAVGTTSDGDEGGFFQSIGRAADNSTFNKDDNKDLIDDIPCKVPGTHQVCSALKGCTCEKT